MADPAGTYINKDDLEAEFGESNIIVWSNKENTTGTANNTAVQAAIDYAERYVEDRFRGSKYAVPFVPKSGALTTVIHWCIRLAGWKLYAARGLRDKDDEGNQLDGIKEDVNAEINSTLAGMRKLDVELYTATPSGPVVM